MAIQEIYFLKKFHQRWLVKKVFESFRKRKEFKVLKTMIGGICQNKYNSILLQKSFRGLFSYYLNETRLKSIVKIHQYKSNRKLLETAFESMVCDRTRKTISKIGYHHVIRQIRFKMLRNSFYKLEHFTRLSRSLRNRKKVIQAK